MQDAASEQLLLRPLPAGELMLHLNLSILTSRSRLRHLDLFPRPLAELFLGTSVERLRLSLSQGRWRSDDWGSLPAPLLPGGEVSAVFAADRWRQGWPLMRRSLGVLLCSSFAQLETVRAQSSLTRFAGHAREGGQVGPWVVVRTALPQQSVCTENLAAWLQLWPCRDKAGISSVLSQADGLTAKRVRHSRYRGLQLTLEPHVFQASNHSRAALNLRLGFTVVLPGLSTIEGVHKAGKQGSSRTDLLGGLLRGGLQACVLASHSLLLIELPDVYAATLVVSSTEDGPLQSVGQSGGVQRSNGILEWKLLANTSMRLHLDGRQTIRATSQESVKDALSRQEPLQTRRIVARDDDSRGLMVLHLENKANSPAAISLVDRLPSWFMLQWHSLAVFINTSQISRSDARQAVRYTPPIGETEIYLLEFSTELPAATSVSVLVRYSVGLFAVDDLPADASRGLEIGSAVTSYRYPHSETMVTYTEPVLIALLLPDQSMAYNVISISSTVVACFVGAMFNLFSRSIVPSRIQASNGV